jgi:SAM-dependent methyltransferase
MHPNSYAALSDFRDKYMYEDRETSILDIGSMDINGSYADLFSGKPSWKYTGLDTSEGKNVDIVVKDAYNYPIEDCTYDVVISGQVMEHVEDLHAFIKEATRVLKIGGFMCMIAPLKFKLHRYPVDCWRIFPDGMKFLLEKVANLTVLRVEQYGRDSIGIALKER